MSITKFTHDELRDLLIKWYDYNPELGTFTTRGRKHKTKKKKDLTKYQVLRLQDFGISEHRAAWLVVHGWLPKRGLVVDHINGLPGDNRIDNLQILSRKSNEAKDRVAGVMAHKSWRPPVQNYSMETQYPVLVPSGESCYTSLRW